MSAWIFSPNGKEILPVYDPQLSKTYVFDPNQPGAGGGIGFSYSQNGTLGISKSWVTEGQAQGWLKISKMTPWIFSSPR